MLMETTQNTPEIVELTELDRRKAGALAITLWWVKGTGHTYVEVIDMDQQPPSVTEIPVLEGQSANHVFNHPYAYAENAQ